MFKKPDTVFLAVSIFYAREAWYKIILEGIVPFVDEESDLESYYVALNSDRGEHIRLSLKTNKNKAIILAKKIDGYFSDYLLKNPSNKTKKSVPMGSLFTDFKNNSIHYGVFDFNFSVGFIRISESFHRDISKVLFSTFEMYGENHTDYSVEIILQIFTVFSNVVSFTKEMSYNFFYHLLQEENLSFSHDVLNQISEVAQSNFEKNKEELKDFILKNYNVQIGKFDGDWLNLSALCINSFLSEIKKINHTTDLNELYPYIVKAFLNMFDFKQKVMAYNLFLKTLKFM
ncbi:hypothetical protein [Flagellimonas meridianipacifica]|uniref:Thiopeptide-type bacteriocin biosynthesis protein n=1 Tax=Flagellimonas meridianipacifica TaxID=1080225 RepID=A0A2T0MCN8_9FLAO|nr:hypothetical protein [Allomuricauda pacifica]PRX55254.1 hypothetical protein CLV81_3663 [Allomuricauda pacifica]